MQVFLLVFVTLQLSTSKGMNINNGNGDVSLNISRFACAFLLHINLVSEVSQGFKMINYIIQKPYEFSG